MAQNHVDSPAATTSLHSLSSRERRLGSAAGVDAHIVVATQNLPRMSAAIHAFIRAGYQVTTYSSPTRLLPRLHRSSSNPVVLLVIDGGRTPAIARAAAIAARSTYPDLPILLLASADAARRTEAWLPTGVSLLRLPVSEPELLAAVAGLASCPDGDVDEPPDDAA
jgi:hypothetical protein